MSKPVSTVISHAIHTFFARLSLLRKSILHRLRPRPFDIDDIRKLRDQRYLLDQSQRLGPVFTSRRNGIQTTFVVGHPLARRLLAAHSTGLPGNTVDLTPLFPVGTLRGMDGDEHAFYRRILARAFRSISIPEHELYITRQIGLCLDEIGSIEGPVVTMDDIAPLLRRAASTIMFRVIFGIENSSNRFAPLRDACLRFRPGDTMPEIGPEQTAAFADIRSLLEAEISHLAADKADAGPSCMLKHLVKADALDATVLGNILYMQTSTHHDLLSLWRWIVRFLAENPKDLEKLRTVGGKRSRILATAIVQETLRLEQSELLLRDVTEGFEFEGVFVPEGSLLHLCIWEGHKDPANFPEPFKFDHTRFLGKKPSPDKYAPFGLDQHRCIGVDIALLASAVFVEQLAARYDLSVLNDLPPFRGRHHWQPHPETRFQLCPATKTPAASPGKC